MNANLTLSTLSFNSVYSDQTGSLRKETSRGINLPENLIIKHREVLDSKTKKPVQQDLVQVDRVMLLSDGSYAPIRVKLTVEIPVDSEIEGADVLAAVERIAQLIQEDDSGLDLADEIFVNKEQ
jgi:hypothetical protein